MKDNLKKSLNLYGLSMVVIGSCIGSGIFLTPSQVVDAAGSPGLTLLAWIAGGLITLTGALTFAEVGSIFPVAGGVYVYIKEAFGKLFGFLYGWAVLLVITSGAIAALALAFAKFLGYLLELSIFQTHFVGIASIVAVTVINIFGVKYGQLFSNIFTGLKLLGVALIIVAGISLPIQEVEILSFEGSNGSSGFLLSLIGVLWSFGGWHHASYIAGEAKNPAKSVPQAMIIGSIIVTVIYILINVAYFHLLPIGGLKMSTSVAADAVGNLYSFGGNAIAAIIAISVIGTVGIFTMSAPRLYYAMAKDGVFFKQLGTTHQTYGTPVMAIILQSAWAVALLLFWGTFKDLIMYVVFIDWIFLSLAACSIFVFRKKIAAEKRIYSAWGYPLTPLIFILISIAFVLNTLVSQPEHAWAGLLLIALGIPAYYFFKNQNTNDVI